MSTATGPGRCWYPRHHPQGCDCAVKGAAPTPPEMGGYPTPPASVPQEKRDEPSAIHVIVEVPPDYTIDQRLDVEEAVRSAVFAKLRGDISVTSREEFGTFRLIGTDDYVTVGGSDKAFVDHIARAVLAYGAEGGGKR